MAHVSLKTPRLRRAAQQEECECEHMATQQELVTAKPVPSGLGFHPRKQMSPPVPDYNGADIAPSSWPYSLSLLDLRSPSQKWILCRGSHLTTQTDMVSIEQEPGFTFTILTLRPRHWGVGVRGGDGRSYSFPHLLSSLRYSHSIGHTCRSLQPKRAEFLSLLPHPPLQSTLKTGTKESRQCPDTLTLHGLPSRFPASVSSPVHYLPNGLALSSTSQWQWPLHHALVPICVSDKPRQSRCKILPEAMISPNAPVPPVFRSLSKAQSLTVRWFFPFFLTILTDSWKSMSKSPLVTHSWTESNWKISWMEYINISLLLS